VRIFTLREFNGKLTTMGSLASHDTRGKKYGGKGMKMKMEVDFGSQ